MYRKEAIIIITIPIQLITSTQSCIVPMQNCPSVRFYKSPFFRLRVDLQQPQASYLRIGVQGYLQATATRSKARGDSKYSTAILHLVTKTSKKNNSINFSRKFIRKPIQVGIIRKGHCQDAIIAQRSSTTTINYGSRQKEYSSAENYNSIFLNIRDQTAPGCFLRTSLNL